MFFLLQTFIKSDKNFKYNLQNIYGLGKARSDIILKRNGLIEPLKSRNLRKSISSKFKNQFKRLPITLARRLKQEEKKNYKNILELQSYKSLRHKLGYPVRGQRTRTNSHTQKVLATKKNLALQPIVKKKNINTPLKKAPFKKQKKNVKAKSVQKKKVTKTKPSKYKI